jgi:UDP-2-acetamido-2-deoxy-ribo-hexuluronate aminotransferase
LQSHRTSNVFAAREIKGAAARCKVPLFDLARQGERLGTSLTERMAKVVEHGQFILGPEVGELESALARYADVRHAVGVSSGRDALIMALMALGVGTRDAVFVPTFTFSATAGAVIGAGGTPVFTDIDPVTCNMSAEHLERVIEVTFARGELRPKVVVPVDLYGLPADYAAIEKVAVKHGLTIVDDAAQSFGARVGTQRVGTLARMTAISFYPTKPLGGFGDGGAILTNDDELAEAVRQIRSHGTRGSGDVAMRLGMTGRLDTLQAAVLLAKLEIFDESMAVRRRLAAYYQQALGGIVGTPHSPDGYCSAWALYTIRSPRRDTVRHRLAQSGIETGLYYRLPLHRHPAFEGCLTGEEALPISEQVSDEVLSLPLHPGLVDADVDRVIEAVLRAVQ